MDPAVLSKNRLEKIAYNRVSEPVIRTFANLAIQFAIRDKPSDRLVKHPYVKNIEAHYLEGLWSKCIRRGMLFANK